MMKKIINYVGLFLCLIITITDIQAQSITINATRYATGATITATFDRGGTATNTDWIGIYRKNQTPGSLTPSTTWAYTNSGTQTAGTTARASGTLTFRLTDADEYYITYFANDGYTQITSPVRFYHGPVIALSTSAPTYEIGAPITITFSNGPALNQDWIGVFAAGTTPNATGSNALKREYVSGRSGTFNANAMTAGTLATGTVLPVGNYYIAYFTRNGNLEATDRINFSVTACNTPTIISKKDSSNCGSGTVTLEATTAGNAINWYASATSNTILHTGTSFTTPIISSTTNYWIVATNGNSYCDGSRQQITATIKPEATPIDLGVDTILCGAASYTLDAGAGGASYLWNDGTTNQINTINNSGTYYAKVTNEYGCSVTDTIAVTFLTPPTVNLGNDISICQDSVITLDAGNPTLSYLWSNGNTQQTQDITTSGSYHVTVFHPKSVNCKGSDTINITVHPKPIINLGNDTTICQGDSFTINAGNSDLQYLWDDGSILPTRSINRTGIYSVRAMDSNSCSSYDSIYILVRAASGGTINAVYGDIATYSFNIRNAQYVSEYIWNFGDGTSDTGEAVHHTYKKNGYYNVTATLIGACNDSIVTTITLDVFDATPNSITEVYNSNDITLYPNPASTTLTFINNNNTQQPHNYNIINALGATIQSGIISNNTNTIDISALANGIYYIKIIDDIRIATQKFEVMQ